ncbi:mediator of RNA polymerase II transcription subunit 19-like isoform X3 [Physella acuta]|uniref:mediator of RNA polymerase II transcription subunit 19-like isoform X3 n=1 Tax=Physella acuta TaxID=109671 RepID=UPI0027DE41E2|nr:mediator of RNA polymerase II transcription subunit 19-like isoform X3 [Physella acuta]
MAELIRRPEPMQSSPRSSPRDRGSRSPAYPRQDSSGTLKTTISLVPGKTPSVIHTGSFYLVKDIPDEAEITGSTNLLNYYNLEHSYNRFLNKKVKEELSAFLPHLPGNIDSPGLQDNSSLRSLIDKAPIIGKELSQLSGSALSGFRLHPGPLPEQYQIMNLMTQKKKKHKKKVKDSEKGSALQLAQNSGTGEPEAKKTKRPKKEDDQKDSKKKRKKDKKKKKKHSPEPTATNGPDNAA